MPQAPESQASTLELRDYLRVLRRRKWIIVFSVVVCVGISLGSAFTRAPKYSTGANVLIERRLIDTIFNPLEQESALDSATRRGNEIQVMSSPRVAAEVHERYPGATGDVGFFTIEGTDVVNVSSTAGDPEVAAKTANAYAKTYLDVRKQLNVEELQQVIDQIQSQIDKLQGDIFLIDLDTADPLHPIVPGTNADGQPRDVRLQKRARLVSRISTYLGQQEQMDVGISVTQKSSSEVLAPAGVPTSPINKDATRTILAGFAIGLVLGVALAFLREYLDDSIKTREDLEGATALTTVGLVPALGDWKKREATQLVSLAQPRSPAAEAYRSVRTSVEFLSLDQPIGSLQVTSALASEGKTTTLANLAITFARAGQRVIVLCCDLRRPRIHEFFGLSNRVGFTSVLLGDTPITTAIQAADRDLPIGLVASGPLPPNPAELLGSKRAVDAIEDLDRRCDLLLIDSPPVLPVTDSLVISGLVDGVLLVANAGSSTKRGVRHAAELLRQVDAPLIGGILNGVHSKHDDYGYAYGDNRYYLDAAPEAKGTADSRNGRNGKSNGKGSGRGRSRVATPEAR